MFFPKKKNPSKKGNKLNFIIIGLLVLLVIGLVIYQLSKFDWSVLDIANNFVEVDESEIIDDPIVNNDILNASHRLFNSGLSNFEYGFTYNLYESNTDVPTADVTFTANEWIGIVGIVIDGLVDEDVKVRQIQISENEGSFDMSIIYYVRESVGDDEIKIYIEESATLSNSLDVWSISETNCELLNIKEGASSSVINNYNSTEFLNYILKLLNGDDEVDSLLDVLNFSSLEFTASSVSLYR